MPVLSRLSLKTKRLMKTKINRRNLLYLVSATILAAGMAVAAVIYVTAGRVREITLEPGFYSKEYLRELETYGGTLNVLAAEFMQWFDGLWHGRQLAFTVAWITIFVSFCIFFIAYRLPSDSE